jgi:DNA-binding Lrp family transcriptional regulator
MKTHIYLTLLFSLIIVSFASSQCEISNLVVEESRCDNGKRNFLFTFDHVNTSDSFEVAGNGNNYGTFAYSDLPVLITDIEPPCSAATEFVVRDIRIPGCEEDISLGDLCCDCIIRDVTFDISDCDLEMFFVDIDLTHVGVGQSFSVEGNGNNYGIFRYNQLPIRVGPLEGDCTTDYEFVIIDRDNPDCREDFSIGKVCCQEGCDIRNLEVEIVDCNGDSCYTVIVDFIHENTGGSQFQVYDRMSLIGVYSYASLPVTIPCYPISGFREEFIRVCDINSINCCEEVEFDSLSCVNDCIRDFEVRAIDCDTNEMFYIEFALFHENTGDSGFCFIANDIILDTFQYDSAYPVLGPFQGGCDSIWTFKVQDKEFQTCMDSFVLDQPCCPIGPCGYGPISVTAEDCDSNNMFHVILDFDHRATTDSFDLLIGGGFNVKRYAYNELPLRLGPFNGDCMTRYYFLAFDTIFNCEADATLGPICCDTLDCRIYDLIVEASDCDSNGLFSVDIDFLAENTSDSFCIIGNGNNYGRFAFGSQPVTIDGLEGDCAVDFEFTVFDCEEDSCLATFQLGEVCCDTFDCRIYDLVVEPSLCDTNGLFSVEIDFLAENTSDSFCIVGNGNNYGRFAFGSQPVTIDGLEGDCTTEYEFVIFDCEEDSCRISYDLGKVCCDTTECRIYDLVAQALECNGDSCFYLSIDFEREETGGVGFEVFDRRGKVGFYPYSRLPLVIECFPISGRDFEYIRVCDFSDPDCCADIEIQALDCEDDCKIFDLVVEASDCDTNGLFSVDIDFLTENTSDSVCIIGNGNEYGRFAVGTQPITIHGLEGDCDTEYEFIVFDCENEDCRARKEVGRICCDTVECRIYDLIVEASDCDTNGLFSVDIDFLTENTSDSICIIGNGNEYGRFAVGTQPITIDGLEGDCDTEYEFIVFDCENEDCRARKEVGRICCDTVECRIYDLIVEASDCDTNGLFSVDIDFLTENTSDSICIIGNGRNYGRFAVGSQPITIDGLEGDCQTEYAFIVFDCENEDCRKGEQLGIVCCDSTECKIFNLEAEALECNGDSCFVLELNFDHVGTSGVGFDVFDRNGRVGFYSYDDLPLIIECYPISGRDQEFIKVCDNDNPDCCAEIEIDALDCEENCRIYELSVEATDCDSNGYFSVVLDFLTEHTSDSICIWGNGNDYGRFAVGSQPITIDSLEGDCTTDYGFAVIDCVDDSCGAFVNLGRICCDSTDNCSITELEAEALRCNGDTCFVLWLNFEHEGTSGEFVLSNRNGPLETFAYTDLPVVMSCFPLSGEDFEYIKVCDKEKPDCCAEIEIEAPDCNDTRVKDLEDLGITAWHSHQTSQLFMDINTAETVEWRIVDIHSRPVLSGRDQGQLEISTESLKSGAYVLIARNGNAMASMTFIKI